MQRMSPQQIAWMKSFFAIGKGGRPAASKTMANGGDRTAGPPRETSDPPNHDTSDRAGGDCSAGGGTADPARADHAAG